MKLQGCCPSLCQGCTIIFSVLTVITGLAVVITGVVLVKNIFAEQMGLSMVGWLLVGAGGFAFVVSLLILTACLTENTFLIKLSFFLGILALLGMTGVMIFSFVKRGKLQEEAQQSWFNFPDSVRQRFEADNSCCGFSRPEEGTGCLSRTPCGSLFIADIEKIATVGIIVPAIEAVALVAAVGFAWFLWGKMKKADAAAKRKELRREAGFDRPSRVHPTTKYGSRFTSAKTQISDVSQP